MNHPTQIIKKPLITEKSSMVKETGWYLFSVDKRSNKIEIKNAVEKLFKVKVDRVTTSITPGKNVKRFGRAIGRTSSVKKAYVKLKEGNIEFFEGV
ncbi:MAG: 50S ribosomal protein L23 [Candidatus Dadabacteria bacterium]|nr:50S ribosomal protein L23 [Candidatus Dadabacteria bacterium]NIS10282.1 50S ribosomal protein L23 [Candidatus Dadabacteria bacterium]NIY23208.1 50S ribosomal protein L23 [Candidatus Dadabacteria bacterium]